MPASPAPHIATFPYPACPEHGPERMVVLEVTIQERLYDHEWGFDTNDWAVVGDIAARCQDCGYGTGIAMRTADEGAGALRLMTGPGTFLSGD